MGNIIYTKCDSCEKNRVSKIRYQYNVIRGRFCYCDSCYDIINYCTYHDINDGYEYKSWVDRLNF